MPGEQGIRERILLPRHKADEFVTFPRLPRLGIVHVELHMTKKSKHPSFPKGHLATQHIVPHTLKMQVSIGNWNASYH